MVLTAVMPTHRVSFQIWEVIIDDSGKVEPNCLCDLNRHQNSVNVVRWSSNGKLLASGDTGTVVTHRLGRCFVDTDIHFSH